MSFTTAQFHCPTELEYVSANDVQNYVTFRAVSKSGATGGYNYVSLDIITGESLCGCKGAECGKVCWHRTLVQAAFNAHPVRLEVTNYTDEQLLRAGHKAANMLRVTRRRTWRVLPADQIRLLACRVEYRARAARRAERAAPVAATKVAA